jgi:acyl-CoA thioesterase-1
MSKKISLPDNSTVLFQGDSITDSERKKGHNESLGDGYVMMTVAWLSALYPEYHLKFIHRGISGNRIRDLKNRWKKDCLDLRANLVSILAGVNDINWKPTATESFREDYKSILQQTQQQSKCQIILLEPFLVDFNNDYFELKEELNKKIDVIRELSQEFETKLIPLNDIFKEACTKRSSSFWSLDGAHTTLAGHALIAQSWIKYVIEEL